MKTNRIIAVSLILFFAASAQAAMKNIVVDETRVSAISTSSDTTTIFGGNAGCSGQSGCVDSSIPGDNGAGYFGECATPTGTSVCNSCTGMTTLNGTYQRCATRSVYGALPLRFTMTPDSVSGTSAVVRAQVINPTATKDLTITSAPTAVVNQPFTVEIPWNDLCLNSDLGIKCDSEGAVDGMAFTVTLMIGVGDGNLTTSNAAKFTVRYRRVNGTTVHLVNPDSCNSADPFCTFRVVPGDEKVYLENVNRRATGPNDDSGIVWSAIRVFHAVSECVPGTAGTCGTNAPDFSTINLGSNAEYEDLSIADRTKVETSLSSNKVTSSLKNDVSYKFNIATVDEATIVDGFLDPTKLTQYDHAATPGQVVGLLDEKKCFIATAAFGSPMEPQVQILRQFRNEFLLTNSLGRWFVQTYYTLSPPVAHFIARHELLRTAVRWSLEPFIAVADLLVSKDQTQSPPKDKQ